ncbi:MAG: PadR family transcriptional regulator [Solirubrobacterales bacterium]
MSRRFFKHGELPLVLLALVAQHPRHGYEIMSELTRLFGPRYRASPGSVYPAIEALQTEGLIDGEAVEGRTVYRITKSGEQALDDRAEMLALVELRLNVRLADGESLESALTSFKARLAPLNGRVDPAAAAEILDRAADEIEQLNPSKQRKKQQRSKR